MKYFIVGALIACFTVTVASSKDERELKMRIASVPVSYTHLTLPTT